MILAPTKQWAMLQLALADFDVISKDPRYQINMGSWHEPGLVRDKFNQVTPICFVCLAGAVMAGTFKQSPHRDLLPRDFSTDWSYVFSALDDMRKGWYSTNINEASEDTLCIYPVTHYNANPAQWRIDMEHFMEYLMLFDL